MADAISQFLIRGFVRGAKLQAAADSTTIKAVLESIITGRFAAEVTNGTTLVSTSEAGGSVGFAIPGDFSPARILEIAERALEWLETQPDPTNPRLSPRRIKRLRADFSRAAL